MDKYFITAILCLLCMQSFAQQGFVSVGGDTQNGNGSVNFSVGQLDYNFYGNSVNLVVEGLQQASEVSAPLPVSLLYFMAKATKENSVSVTWSTTSETNNDYFTIERSKDAGMFEKVTTVQSGGNSTIKQDYAFTDPKPYQGVSYYRLTQTDKDGKFSLSQIEKVVIDGSAFTATASPNPTIEIVQLKINGDMNKKMGYLLLDMNGKILLKALISNPLTPISLGNLSRGTYVLKVMQEGKSIQSFKIIKQK